MSTYTLFGTSACHLCELAQACLESLQKQGISLDYEVVDIALDDALFERYGLLIPVLRSPDERELNWPFDERSVWEFLCPSD